MKNTTKLFIALGIVASLFIGFMIGISVEYPSLEKDTISGTIGKVKNYRKTKASETDIQLQNELVSDTTKQNLLVNYLNFYYLSAVKMNGDIEYSVTVAKAIEDFKSKNETQIASLAKYGAYLSYIRSDLLLAITACQNPMETDPVLLRNRLNQANNIIAQINYRKRVVLDFIGLIDSFVESDNSEEYEGLCEAHDLLILNELNSSIISRDKLTLKYLDKKVLHSNFKNTTWFDQQKLNGMVQQDIEKLGVIMDSEKLGIIFDAEKLGTIYDAEKLGLIFDTEKLGVFSDTEKLGIIFDAEKLGTYMDSEKLGIFFDSEKLGIIFDSEKLGLAGW